MLVLDNVNNIDEALKLKGNKVYINKEEYIFNGYLNEEIIGLEVYDGDEYKGKIVDIYTTGNIELLVINGKRRHMVPYRDEFIEKIDLDNKKIYIDYIKGLDNED